MDENQDLWRQIKAAKNHLFTQTAFLQKYTTAFPVSITTGKTSAPFTTKPDTSLTNLPDNINTGLFQEKSVSITTQGKQDTSIWRKRGSVILDVLQIRREDSRSPQGAILLSGTVNLLIHCRLLSQLLFLAFQLRFLSGRTRALLSPRLIHYLQGGNNQPLFKVS